MLKREPHIILRFKNHAIDGHRTGAWVATLVGCGCCVEAVGCTRDEAVENLHEMGKDVWMPEGLPVFEA